MFRLLLCLDVLRFVVVVLVSYCWLFVLCSFVLCAVVVVAVDVI